MVTISKPISASQVREYHRAEFSNAQENYYTEGEKISGTWHGLLAAEWGLYGAVSEEHFARLSEGQHPLTGEQLVSHQTPRTYLSSDGKRVRTVEHRAGWDATFSAPKTVSLSALVGGDARIITAHRESVTIALTELERFVQARIGGNIPAENTGKWAAATFEHDSSRPVDGYAAPQLHTHAVLFNLTITADGTAHALQPQELFRSQKYATAVYRAELAVRLKALGYEIERGEHGSPEIKGYSREYVEASSPRRQQIQEHLAKHGVHGAEAAEIAAHQTRAKKQNISREEMLSQHQAMAAKYGNQAWNVAQSAHRRNQLEASETNPIEAAQASIRSSVSRNIEREAVIRERAILTDALRYGMGSVRIEDIRAELTSAIERKKLLETAQSRCVERGFTTPEMKSYEEAIIQQMVRGRGVYDALVPAWIQGDALASRTHLNTSQSEAVRTILENHDQIMGLEGAAGTGKTTALEAVCDATKQAGYRVEGLAPTSRAALNLESAGIPTETMQRHLTKLHEESSNTKCLYVVDESSMASTRQLHDFLNGIGNEDRVLFVGDTRQHEAVDAGRPYAQLQEAGMQSAQLTEILRQKDAGLKTVVEQLSSGDIESAIAGLQQQGRVHEFMDREEQIRAIARTYLEQPRGTLVVSPDNDSRIEIARVIHAEMQGSGAVALKEHSVRVLVARQGMTHEDRLWAQNYEPGDMLRYTKSSKVIGVKARELVRVIAANDKENLITVERQNGRKITYDPRSVYGVTSYREAERNFSEGDRIQFTAAFHPQKIANRELGTLERIDENGNLVLKMDSGRVATFNLRQHPHLDYGYAVTSHSSQGETVDRVLIHVDSEHAHKGLINSRMAYVAVSRARYDARIFTNDADSLAWEMNKDVSHTSALRPEEVEEVVKQAHVHGGQSMGLGQ